MFDGIKKFINKVVKRMFPVENLHSVIGSKFALSNEMIKNIELWAQMNQGNAPWTVGSEYVDSLGVEQGICREFANITLNEMETSVSNEKLNTIYQEATKDLNEHLQSGLALGSFVIKPLGENKVEYVTADKFVPIEFDTRGRLVDVAFIEVKREKEDSYYFRFERHKLSKEGLTITNKAYHSTDSSNIGREVDLKSVEEWSKLPPSVLYPGVIKPDFGYYRNPIKNEIDGSFCGVSVFANSVNLIKKTDVQFSRIDWEFESGERAIHVDEIALQPRIDIYEGKTKYVLPKLNKRLYRGLNLQQGDNKELFQDFSPEFRESNLINGLNAYLRRIEYNVGLAYGDLSDAQDVEKTATEVKIAKKRKYNMVTAIQNNLKECLEDLVYALAFYNALSKSGYQFLCNFEDSILVDEEEEREQDRKDVVMGVMSLAEYRAKWYGETLEQAQANLPEQVDDVME